MSIEIFVGKQTGTALAPTLPVEVVDTSDPQAFLSLDDAIDAVDAAAGVTIPTSLPPFDVPNDGNPGIQRLSPHAFRFQINYRSPNLRPLHPPSGSEVRVDFEVSAEPKFLMWSPEVAVFAAPPHDGDPGTMNSVILGAGDGQFGTVGLQVTPGKKTFGKDLVVPIGTVTGTWVRTICKVIRAGCTNSLALTSGAYAVGEIQVVRGTGQQASDTEFRLHFDWSYKENVSGETRGAVTGIAYKGHELVWEYRAQKIDRARLLTTLAPDRVVVNQVWPAVDLAAILGVEPP